MYNICNRTFVGDIMIKSPITTKGRVKYFEIVKIFLLLSFFYAFSSILTDKNSMMVSQASIYFVFTLFGLLTLIISIVSVQETINLFKLMKSYTLHFIQFKGVIVLKKGTIIISKLHELTLFNNTHLTLCVIQR